jgi:6-pyruvoyltetrahydropterin/6-carboxytetrahydropterin synthase
MGKYQSTKFIELGSTAFRQPKASSHCKNIHGYQLKAKVWLGANELDENNWVFDFGSFKELTKTLQKTFDHKLVIDKNDPAKSIFRELERYGAAEIIEMDGVGIEKFAQFVFEQTDTYVKFCTKDRVWCDKVEIFEHEKNSAIYCKEFLKDIIVKDASKPVTGIQPTVAETPKPPTQIPASPEQISKGPRPAPLSNPVTTGWSNPFAGTSWGS